MHQPARPISRPGPGHPGGDRLSVATPQPVSSRRRAPAGAPLPPPGHGRAPAAGPRRVPAGIMTGPAGASRPPVPHRPGPGVGRPAPGPTPPAAPPTGPPVPDAGPPRRRRRRRAVAWLTVLVLLGGLGALGRHLAHAAPASANVGDCVSQTGANSVSTVACGDRAARFTVVGRLENRTEHDAGLFACADLPTATSSSWQGTAGRPGSVLCLAPVGP